MKSVVSICIMVVGFAMQTHAQIITTIGGDGTTVFNGDSILATSSGLASGGYINFDKYGNLYVSMQDQQRVRKIDLSTGIITTVAGTGVAGYNGEGILATTAQLNYPTGIVFDTMNNLYISDATNIRIRKVDAVTGLISTIAGNGVLGYGGDGGPATSAQLAVPMGLSMDALNNLYMSNASSMQVRKVSTSGIINTVAGTPGFVGFSGDNGLATLAKLDAPQKTASDTSGNLYIADADNGRIRKVNTLGIITTIAGTGAVLYNGDGIPATTANLYQPRSIAIEKATNTLYICDRSHQRIRKVDNAGIITTVAGNGTAGFSGDGGLATSAQLYMPYDITLDNCGNLYVYDGANYRIRKVWFNSDSTYTASIAISPNDTVSAGTTTTYTATTSSTMAMPTYQWVKNGVHVGSNSKYYTDTAANGDNVYCIVTARTCSGVLLTDTTNTIHAVVVPDGIGNVTNNAGYMVYPNPATNTLHIAQVTTPTSYKLTDVVGVEKMKGELKQGNNSININALIQGIYLLELVDNEGVKTVKKIVKE